MMNVNLIAGEFATQETLGLITKLIDLKISDREDKITNEEDIQTPELKIKSLQNDLDSIRNYISEKVSK